MQYQPFEPGIDVNGQTAWALVDGMGAFSLLGSQYLLAEGIGKPNADGIAQVDPEGWYSQVAWLKAFANIGATIGDLVLFQIGQSIPKNAKFPAWVADPHTAVKAVDIAYHMNHRRNGAEMFDPEKGTMLEGIGHYGYAGESGARLIVSVCNNPYPCAFDRGILTTMVQRFEPGAKVVHDDTKECRNKGKESCTYRISW